MSDNFTAGTVSEAVRRLDLLCSTLKQIHLWNEWLNDAELSELAEKLLVRPDVVTEIWLCGNKLTDETGLKLARYLAASTTIHSLNLFRNGFGPATYSAVAQALRVNTSLRQLSLYDNEASEASEIEAGFVEALRVNPSRPAGSVWFLFKVGSNDLGRLKAAASELGHASMQSLLLTDIEHKMH